MLALTGKFAFSWRILQLVLAVAFSSSKAVVRTRMLALLVFSLGQPAQPASQLLSLTHKFEARAPDLAKALVRRRDPRPPSNQRPLVFFHLRKSGGSQVRDALYLLTLLTTYLACATRRLSRQEIPFLLLPCYCPGAQLLLPVAQVQLHTRAQRVAGQQGQGRRTAGAVRCTVSKGSGTVTRATRLECLRVYVPTNYELPTHAYKLLN